MWHIYPYRTCRWCPDCRAMMRRWWLRHPVKVLLHPRCALADFFKTEFQA